MYLYCIVPYTLCLNETRNVWYLCTLVLGIKLHIGPGHVYMDVTNGIVTFNLGSYSAFCNDNKCIIFLVVSNVYLPSSSLTIPSASVIIPTRFNDELEVILRILISNFSADSAISSLMRPILMTLEKLPLLNSTVIDELL